MKTIQIFAILIALTALGLLARQLISFSGVGCFISECINEKNALETIEKTAEYQKFMAFYPDFNYTYKGDVLGGYAILKNENAMLSFYLVSQGNIEIFDIGFQCFNRNLTYHMYEVNTTNLVDTVVCD